MSHWVYVTAGWLITYAVFGVWFYTSRVQKEEKKDV